MHDSMYVHWSHNNIHWSTPREFLDQYKLGGWYDPCPIGGIGGLTSPWKKRTFVNPPYGREIEQWIDKAIEEKNKGNTIALLVPARTDTNWFYRLTKHATDIYFIKGRLKFGGAKNSAPFPSVLVYL